MIFLLLFRCSFLFAQENEAEHQSGIEEQIENLAQASELESEDDSHIQLLDYYLRHPLNLNDATPEELKEFKILSDLQVYNFFMYKRLFGPLINIYELQAIPSWNISDIRKLVPFIAISDSKTIFRSFKERVSAGENNLMLRYSMVLPKSKGYARNDSTSNGYKGSRPHMLFRYKHNYKNLLQYGFLGDKDAGEEFFRGSQRMGFDFYSFHLFSRKMGIVKALAVGDFTVNFGQGLIHWQVLAFKKSASIIFAKRQADVLRPYTSSGEYNFHRGVGLSLGKKNWETTLFASIRNFDATIRRDSAIDTEGSVSSLLKSGYHRSLSELKNRNNLEIVSVGSNIRYGVSKWHLGLNCVQYFFSKNFRISDKPYDLFAIDGDRWANLSFDYSYTFRNIHLFGELATDKNRGVAMINGMIASLDRSVDLSVVFRKIQKEFQSFWGNAFTENAMPSNETGLYTGVSIRRGSSWKIDVYADFYKFPWLVFRTNAPSYGSEYLVQVTFAPSKQASLILRYKKEGKQVNIDGGLPTSSILETPRRSLRYHFSYNISREVSINNRVELLCNGKKDQKLNGFLTYADVRYKPISKPYSANMRLQYFETDGYNERIYAYENDVLYGYNTPAFFEKGFRWYINLRTDVSKWSFLKSRINIELWIKYGLTRFFELDKIGSELDEIQGKNRSEIKFQLLFSR
ncbi:MAG TPA: hypothetical protein VKA49_05235 [Flavitalea sp.]|nr:hypothetical protein [Flavitalea sp.]